MQENMAEETPRLVPKRPSRTAGPGVKHTTHELELYELRAKSWKVLAHGQFMGLPAWSADGTYLYYQDLRNPVEPLFRWKFSSGAVKTVAILQKILATGLWASINAF